MSLYLSLSYLILYYYIIFYYLFHYIVRKAKKCSKNISYRLHLILNFFVIIILLPISDFRLKKIDIRTYTCISKYNIHIFCSYIKIRYK